MGDVEIKRKGANIVVRNPAYPGRDAQTYSTYLHVLIENSPGAIVVLDSEHRCEMCNPAFERLFQYRCEELTGRNLDELIASPEMVKEAKNMTRSVLGGRKVHAVTRRWRKDHETVEVEIYGVPLVVNGEFRGVYGLYQNITERTRAKDAVRQLSSRLMHLQDEERRRIARDLHDTTSQELAMLNMNLQRLEHMLGRADPGIRELLAGTVQLARECSQRIRTTSYLLHPPLLDEVGLTPAVLWFVEGFAQRSGIHVNLTISPQLGRLLNTAELALYRVLQEALANVLRHSGSSEATVAIKRSRRAVKVIVADRGRGLRQPAGPGVGIAGMRERLEELGGSLQVRFSPRGTTVRAVLPLDRTGTEGYAKTTDSDC